jgi:hypothetical protein
LDHAGARAQSLFRGDSLANEAGQVRRNTATGRDAPPGRP